MRLILHAGTHKTGTTSIQKVLDDSQDWLKDHGLLYPVTEPFVGSRPHHKFTHALASDKHKDLAKAQAFISAVKAQADADKCKAVIISSEAVYRHLSGGIGLAGLVAPDYWERRKEYLQTLAGLLSEFDVEVVLCFRDYGYFLSWLHRTVTREGAWEGDPSEFKKAFSDRFDYDRQIALFRDVFPNVRTYQYEDAKQVGVIQSFFDVIGFPMPPDAASVWERPTKRAIVPI
jgi:hypothetical protein